MCKKIHNIHNLLYKLYNILITFSQSSSSELSVQSGIPLHIFDGCIH